MDAIKPASALRRVGAYWLMYFVVLWVCAIPRAMVPPEWSALVWGTAAAVLLLLATRWWFRAEPSLTPASAWQTLLQGCSGVSAGLAIYALNLLVLGAWVGPIDLLPVPAMNIDAIALAVLGIFALAAMEELGFRGYPLRTLIASIGFWRAQALVALVFALSHLAFGWHWLAVIIGVFPSALLFGVAAARSGGLALPIGLHAGLNLARVAAGESDPAVLYTMSVNAEVQQRLAAVAPALGVLITMGATMLLWRWYARPPD